VSISAEPVVNGGCFRSAYYCRCPCFFPRTPGHVVFTENRKGISFDKIFGPWTDGASRIIITDPYIRKFHQARNVMELIEMLIRRKQPEDQDRSASCHCSGRWEHSGATRMPGRDC
jgi:ATP-dependent Lon protease